MPNTLYTCTQTHTHTRACAHTHVHTHIYIYIYIWGAYNKFPDFFPMSFWNFRGLLKIQYVIAIHLMRWLTNFYDFSFKSTSTAAIGIHPTKAWLSQLVNFKNTVWTLEERYAIKFCFKLGKIPCDESWVYWYDPETKRVTSGRMLVFLDPRRPDRANPPSTGMVYMHWVPTGQTVNKEYYVEVFKGVQKEIPRESNRLSGISTRTIHQSSTLSLSQTIWPRWASR